MSELIKDIKLSIDVYKRLLDIKVSKGLSSFNEVVRYLLDVYDGKVRPENNNTNTLCVELGETRGSVTVWGKVLRKKGILIPTADDPEIYVLNKELLGCG
jgi:hypothetical protein